MKEMIIECPGCGTPLSIPPEGVKFECPGCGQRIEIERGTETKKLPRGPQLISCPDCGGKVSTEATECPHCGYEMSGLFTGYQYRKSYDINYSLYQVAQPIVISCPECGQRAKVKPDDFGKEFNCAVCNAKLKAGKKKGGKSIYYPPETPESGDGEYFRQVVKMQNRRKLFVGLLGFAFSLILYAAIPFIVWGLLGGIAGVIALAFCAWCFFQYLFSQLKGE